jgi:hypothetical protein
VEEPLQQRVIFDDIASKPVEIEFTQPAQSSDGGVALLRKVDQDLGLSERLAAAVGDRRDPDRIDHPLVELFRARIFAIACGYPDCNDLDRLCNDPMLKLVCGQAPLADSRLASQPTLSRFENSVRRTELLRSAYALCDAVLAAQRERRRKRPPRRITIDMDPTDDPTYGGQQLTFFNAHYDNWCYLPMVTTIQFDDEPEHFSVAPVLRPGNAKGSLGAIAILERLLPRVQAAFPGAKIEIRMDGGFASPPVFDWLEASGLKFYVNFAKNPVLLRLAEPYMKKVREEARRQGRTVKAYADLRYKATKWSHPRRLVLKAEVTVLEGREPRDNPRFVVTNSPRSPQRCYRIYTGRGNVENVMKELHYDLRFDLTSCTTFSANQLREILTVGAYVLYQHLRYDARRTEHGRSQVGTLRDQLIKIGVTVYESVRRIVLKAPKAFAGVVTWKDLALALGARTG